MQTRYDIFSVPIAFSEKCHLKDFDDWDDVGLNISKPPELLHIYRDGLKNSGQNQFSTSTQTHISNEIDQSDIIKEQVMFVFIISS